MSHAQHSRKWKQNTLKGLVQEKSSNAVKPGNSFIDVTRTYRYVQ